LKFCAKKSKVHEHAKEASSMTGYPADRSRRASFPARLLAAAAEHPLVLKAPAPQVYFMKFGESALEFELRCVVADVNQRLSASSDLHFDIFGRFRAAGIEIPYPQREIHV
jgi:small-conductance mechanosensitive channel